MSLERPLGKEPAETPLNIKEPARIMAEKVGLGVSNLRDIDMLGEDIEAVRQEFELPSRFQKGRAF